MCSACYVIILAFHPKLQLRRVIVKRSYGQSEDSLNYLNYLTYEQWSFKDNKTLLKLKDCASNVLAQNSTYAVSKMFSNELKLEQIVYWCGLIKHLKTII